MSLFLDGKKVGLYGFKCMICGEVKVDMMRATEYNNDSKQCLKTGEIGGLLPLSLTSQKDYKNY